MENKKIRKSLSMSEISTNKIKALIPHPVQICNSSSSSSASDGGTNDKLALFSAEFERKLELDCEKVSAKYLQ